MMLNIFDTNVNNLSTMGGGIGKNQFLSNLIFIQIKVRGNLRFLRTFCCVN